MPGRAANYTINNTALRVVYQDITAVGAEALVSSDDNHLTMSGGVSKAIAEAGGEQLREEARKHVPGHLGNVVVTSAGRLPSK